MTPREKIDKEFTKYPKRLYPKGQIFIFPDETPKHLMYILSGRVRSYDVSYRGDEVIVYVFKPPAFFPLSIALNDFQNKYFYKAEVDSEVRLIPIDEALKFIKDNPDVMYELLCSVYRGVEVMLARNVQLMSGSANSILLFELINECRYFAKKLDDGSCQLTATESDLAARTGLSRETINREIHKLKEMGLVKVSKQGINVPSSEKLQAKFTKN